jgi:hypothetical protein
MNKVLCSFLLLMASIGSFITVLGMEDPSGNGNKKNEIPKPRVNAESIENLFEKEHSSETHFRENTIDITYYGIRPYIDRSLVFENPQIIPDKFTITLQHEGSACKEDYSVLRNPENPHEYVVFNADELVHFANTGELPVPDKNDTTLSYDRTTQEPLLNKPYRHVPELPFAMALKKSQNSDSISNTAHAQHMLQNSKEDRNYAHKMDIYGQESCLKLISREKQLYDIQKRLELFENSALGNSGRNSFINHCFDNGTGDLVDKALKNIRQGRYCTQRTDVPFHGNDSSFPSSNPLSNISSNQADFYYTTTTTVQPTRKQTNDQEIEHSVQHQTDRSPDDPDEVNSSNQTVIPEPVPSNLLTKIRDKNDQERVEFTHRTYESNNAKKAIEQSSYDLKIVEQNKQELSKRIADNDKIKEHLVAKKNDLKQNTDFSIGYPSTRSQNRNPQGNTKSEEDQATTNEKSEDDIEKLFEEKIKAEEEKDKRLKELDKAKTKEKKDDHKKDAKQANKEIKEKRASDLEVKKQQLQKIKEHHAKAKEEFTKKAGITAQKKQDFKSALTTSKNNRSSGSSASTLKQNISQSTPQSQQQAIKNQYFGTPSSNKPQHQENHQYYPQQNSQYQSMPQQTYSTSRVDDRTLGNMQQWRAATGQTSKALQDYEDQQKRNRPAPIPTWEDDDEDDDDDEPVDFAFLELLEKKELNIINAILNYELLSEEDRAIIINFWESAVREKLISEASSNVSSCKIIHKNKENIEACIKEKNSQLSTPRLNCLDLGLIREKAQEVYTRHCKWERNVLLPSLRKNDHEIDLRRQLECKYPDTELQSTINEIKLEYTEKYEKIDHWWIRWFDGAYYERIEKKITRKATEKLQQAADAASQKYKKIYEEEDEKAKQEENRLEDEVNRLENEQIKQEQEIKQAEEKQKEYELTKKQLQERKRVQEELEEKRSNLEHEEKKLREEHNAAHIKKEHLEKNESLQKKEQLLEETKRTRPPLPDYGYNLVAKKVGQFYNYMTESTKQTEAKSPQLQQGQTESTKKAYFNDSIEQIQEKNDQLEKQVQSLEQESVKTNKQRREYLHEMNMYKQTCAAAWSFSSDAPQIRVPDIKEVYNQSEVLKERAFHRKRLELMRQGTSTTSFEKSNNPTVDALQESDSEGEQTESDDELSDSDDSIAGASDGTQHEHDNVLQTLEDCGTIIHDEPTDPTQNLDNSTPDSVDFIVTPQFQLFLEELGIDPQQCLEFNGTEEQKIVHERMMRQLEALSTDAVEADNERGRQEVKEFIKLYDETQQLKHENRIILAKTIAVVAADTVFILGTDFPLKAAVQSVAHTISHPLEYAENIVIGYKNLGKFLIECSIECSETLLNTGSPEERYAAAKYYNELYHKLNHGWKELKQQQKKEIIGGFIGEFAVNKALSKLPQLLNKIETVANIADKFNDVLPVLEDVLSGASVGSDGAVSVRAGVGIRDIISAVAKRIAKIPAAMITAGASEVGVLSRAMNSQSSSGGNDAKKPKKDDNKKQDKENKRESFQPLTNKEARRIAEKWGYIEGKPDFDTRGKIAFRHPKQNTWISPDQDGHKGGVWKEFNNRGKRLSTLDKDGNIIAG